MPRAPWEEQMRKANFVLASVVGIAMALVPRPLHAQNANVDQIAKGSRLVALSQVPVRDAAPSGGAVYAKGQVVDTLHPQQDIKVEDWCIVHTLLGHQKWVRFENLQRANNWVLVGTMGTKSNLFAEAR